MSGHRLDLARKRQTHFKKTKLNPWLSEQWCVGQMTGDDIWPREDVLYQYQLPYDPRHPFIGFDERPCFLIDDVGALLPMSPGKAKRDHDEYAKNGSCCVFLAFEPHTGCRDIEVRARRTAVDDAEFMNTLSELHDPHAECIRHFQYLLYCIVPWSVL